MAAFYTCDGCEAAVENPIQLGHAFKRDYCEACAPNAKAFMAAEEMERATIQSVFAGKRQKLIELHGADGFRLPDVP